MSIRLVSICFKAVRKSVHQSVSKLSIHIGCGEAFESALSCVDDGLLRTLESSCVALNEL